jgi:hypothetical protein
MQRLLGKPSTWPGGMGGSLLATVLSTMRCMGGSEEVRHVFDERAERAAGSSNSRAEDAGHHDVNNALHGLMQSVHGMRRVSKKRAAESSSSRAGAYYEED